MHTCMCVHTCTYIGVYRLVVSQGQHEVRLNLSLLDDVLLRYNLHIGFVFGMLNSYDY